MDFLGFETEDSSDLSDSSLSSSVGSIPIPSPTKGALASPPRTRLPLSPRSPARRATVAGDVQLASSSSPPGSPIFPGSPIMPRSASSKRDPLARVRLKSSGAHVIPTDVAQVLTPERIRASLSGVGTHVLASYARSPPDHARRH